MIVKLIGIFLILLVAFGMSLMIIPIVGIIFGLLKKFLEL
jgi:hypothetical protein